MLRKSTAVPTNVLLLAEHTQNFCDQSPVKKSCNSKRNNQITQNEKTTKITPCIHTDDEPENSHLLGMSKINLANTHCQQINKRLDELETRLKGNTQIDDLKTLLDAELAQLLAPTPAPKEHAAQPTPNHQTNH